MKKMRWTALLAALLMATTLMAGCQAEEKPGNTPVIEDDTPYNGELPLTKEPAKLRVMTHSGFAANMPEPNNDLLYYKETQKATGVEIEWDVVPNDSYTEVLQTKLAAGVDLPDIMNMYVGANVVNAYENDLFLPLDDLIEKYGYWTKKWFADGNEMYKDMWTMADGHIYSIQDYVLPTYNQVVPLYNTKWLEKLGKEVPTTLEEFEELVYAMKGVDFNGNGKDDEIILSGEINNYNTFGYTWGLEMHDGAYGFQTDDGKTVTCDYTDDRYREFLTFSNKLYQDGILDKELMSNTSTMMME